MRSWVKILCRTSALLFAALALSSCQVGFMSVDSQQSPTKQSLTFSSDPNLIASRVALSLNRSPNIGLTICEKGELVIANAKSMEVPVQENIQVQLSSSNTQGRFYLDSSCSTPITSIAVNKKESRKDFYYKSNGYNYASATNTDTLTPSYATFISKTVSANVVQVTTQLTFDGAPTSLNAGVCSGAFTVTARDGLGHAFIDNPKTVNLASGSLGDFFANSSDCNSGVSPLYSAQLTASNPSAILYFKSISAAGPINMIASAVGLSSASALVSLTHTAINLSFKSAPSTLNVGVCSGAVTVTAFDGLGKAYSENTKIVSLSSGSVGVFYSDSSCSASVNTVNLSPSNFSSTIYFKATSVASSANLSATFSGLTGASHTISLTHTAVRLTFDAAPSSLNVGVCSGSFSVTSRDALGNAYIENTKGVNLSSGSVGVFYSDSSCSASVNTVNLSPSNFSFTIYFKATSVATSANLLANSAGLTGASQTISLTHTAVRLTFDSAPSSLNVGVCSGAFNVTSRDALGNTFSENTKSVSLSAGSVGAFYLNPAACSSGAPSVASVSLSTAAPSATLYFKATTVAASASLAASFSGLTGANQTISLTHTATQLTFDSAPSSLNVGSCSGSFSVTVRDGLGTAFSENTKAVSLSSGSVGAFYLSPTACSTGTPSVASVSLSAAAPAATLYFKATSVASSANLSATFSGLTSASQTVSLTHTATQLTFDSAPSSLNVGSCSGSFSVTVRDGLGTAFSENTKTVSLSSGSVGAFYLNPAACSSGAPSVASVSLSTAAPSATLYFKATTVAASASLAASFSGLTGANQTISLTHTATQLTFDAAPSSLNIGVCSPAFNVTSRDALGNAFSENGKTIALDSGGLGSYYSNSTDCTNGTNPITLVNVSNSAPSAFLFIKTINVNAGWIILTGSFSTLIDASSTITINHFVLDSSFNASGSSPGQIASSSLTGEYVAMAQYQGGYLVAGYVNVSAASRAYLARFDSSGNLLSQFTENIGANINSSVFNAIFVDGTDIYAAGYADLGASSGKDLFVVKLDSSLTLNSNFNSQGSVTKDLNGNDSVIGITKNSSGELVAVDDKFEVVFFNKDSGNFISAFQLTSPPSNAVASKIAMDSSGNVVVAGTSNSKIAVIRFNPANSGSVTLNNPTEFQLGKANSVWVDSSNRILLAGQSGTQMAVVRLGAGALVKDNSFGTSGILTDSAMSEAKDIALDSIGNLLIVGTASNQMAIRRYQPNGAMINPLINIKTLAFAQGASVANDILLDGFKIMLGGFAGSNPAMARLFP